MTVFSNISLHYAFKRPLVSWHIRVISISGQSSVPDTHAVMTVSRVSRCARASIDYVGTIIMTSQLTSVLRVMRGELTVYSRYYLTDV